MGEGKEEEEEKWIKEEKREAKKKISVLGINQKTVNFLTVKTGEKNWKKKKYLILGFGVEASCLTRR